ncbi:MAG: hypothetical protein M3Q10_10295, partial [Chloroflexota bacterium]|nr:hypothetical protein [Chloroflexota bacterium]
LPVGGGSQLHGGAPSSVGAQAAAVAADQASEAGGDAAHTDAHGDEKAGRNEIWPDLTTKEALTLFPLALLTIVTGVYPAPVFAIVEPAFERILAPFT